MLPLNELDYLRLREAAERALASATHDISAKATQLKMAEEYAKRIAKIQQLCAVD